MNRKHFAALAVALAGTLAAGAANARNDVQWSLSIGVPHVGVVIGNPGYPVYSQRDYFYGPPVVYAPRAYEPRYGGYHGGHHGGHYGGHHGRHYGRGYGDADRDGIPNRYDRVYNPRWDRDGDGVPNRHDRWDNRRGDRRGDWHRGPRHGG